ncbi:MAG: pyridoxal-phosphate dependent enzyme [Endomicrobium sp.]|uniref:pyridoxal-phosphate dependent enzyme n=1 Tax=Candidatus Endomicrobiellum pyrsonymphae TaxID=1408203 RepID=UPI003574EBF7|nr:pyridoxal-phosphate dependent enzyme [Endomicrobium sp.]MCA6072835.1 pyridoxal-phosphate dependent enzyme [Endomicrobium sp.]
MIYKGLIEKYKKNLPISDATSLISLYERNTSLMPARNLSEKLEFNGEIHFKFEGMNPTGSFKDREMITAVSKIVESGSLR